MSKLNPNHSISRREFLSYAGAAALSLLTVTPGVLRGAQSSGKIRLGMIGCGGRGTWLGNLFQEHGGYEIAAAADYFQDRVDNFGEKFNVPGRNRFTGLSCYQQLLDENLDAVAIISPPYFHPEQAAAAVDAGTHVYLAKPVAVDVPGCLSISESGDRATKSGLSFLVDFQTRTDPFYIEAIKQVHDGALGTIANGDVEYHAGRLSPQAEPGTPEARLRNWVFDQKLSGDIIVEQNIHALDVASWVLDASPVKAYGGGGRKVRTDVGDCWDYFSVTYEFPDNVQMTFSSKQYGQGHSDILCRVYGKEGTLHTHYGGRVMIRGNRPYRGGETTQIYREGAVRNIAEFHRTIEEQDYANPTVEPSVRSNLTSILGREAAYARREITMDELMDAKVKIIPNLNALEA